MGNTLARNLAWDFNIQEFKDVQPNVNVKGGDTIITTCVWDTTSSATTIRGGDASDQEMCLALVWYYPQVKDAGSSCNGTPYSSGTFDNKYPWGGPQTTQPAVGTQSTGDTNPNTSPSSVSPTTVTVVSASSVSPTTVTVVSAASGSEFMCVFLAFAFVILL